ncbi:MAG: hypothetical protein MI807_06725 [Verrucomicrobiales bacterium]|nr:hypothetical protein [Verrucomicrobiales bacterium]
MSARIFPFLALLFLVPETQAIPNSFFGNGNAIPIIPAFPRFNADLTQEFLDEAKWKEEDFSGPWSEEPSLPRMKVRRMTANPVVMGEVPMTVVAYSDGSETTELAIHFLDAGLYFGYQPGGEKDREARTEGRNRRHEFDRHFERVAESVRERLEEGCGRGKSGVMGRHPMLRAGFTEYRWDNFVLRLIEREDHSVSLHIFRRGNEPNLLISPEWSGADRRDRQAMLEKNVVESETGEIRIEGLPVFTQGMTPFCGIHSLAMVGYHLGFRGSPEWIAASADFKNTGSAGGSDMIGVHRAVAEELDMRVGISSHLDWDRVERSLRQGLPVIVWRRVSAAREKHHAAVAKSESVPLALTREQIEELPQSDEKGSPSHASVITGIDREAGVVHYLEPWGYAGKNRRMRVEELGATAYAVFHFRL